MLVVCCSVLFVFERCLFFVVVCCSLFVICLVLLCAGCG